MHTRLLQYFTLSTCQLPCGCLNDTRVFCFSSYNYHILLVTKCHCYKNTPFHFHNIGLLCPFQKYIVGSNLLETPKRWNFHTAILSAYSSLLSKPGTDSHWISTDNHHACACQKAMNIYEPSLVNPQCIYDKALINTIIITNQRGLNICPSTPTLIAVFNVQTYSATNRCGIDSYPTEFCHQVVIMVPNTCQSTDNSVSSRFRLNPLMKMYSCVCSSS